MNPDFPRPCLNALWVSNAADYKCKLDGKWCYGRENCQHPDKLEEVANERME